MRLRDPMRRALTLEVGMQNAGVGTWSLKVTLAGEKTREFEGLKNGTPKFDKLTWVGFTSNATSKTVFYLDDVEIVNES